MTIEVIGILLILIWVSLLVYNIALVRKADRLEGKIDFIENCIDWDDVIHETSTATYNQTAYCSHCGQKIDWSEDNDD